MLSTENFIRSSLELNLFFARIAKEHSFFMESGFTKKDAEYANEADFFKRQFEGVLEETIALANGLITPEVSLSGELVTPYTLKAEQISSYYTGIMINSKLTRTEESLVGSTVVMTISPMMEQRVSMLNDKSAALTTELIHFKSNLLNDVRSCKVFTAVYPLMVNHFLREERFYLKKLTVLQNREEIPNEKDLIDKEVFWSGIMSGYAKFIRGLLDPSEEELITTANYYGNEFDKLVKKAVVATGQTVLIKKITSDTFNTVKGFRSFILAITGDLIQCKIKSIIYPLLADYILREANYYLRILGTS
ncbi:MAG: DUF2935 domain-containing protein [Clostridiaceae bacterium]